MLGQLMSKDDKEVEAGFVHISLRFLQAAEAEDKIDKFLETQSKEEADQAQRAQVDQGYNENVYISFELQFTAGCRTIENRSVINTTEVKEEKRKKEAARLKELGNQVLQFRGIKITDFHSSRHSEEESIEWLRSTTQAL